MADHVLDAVAMARAVAGDPQFAFPEQPRLVPGLVTVPTVDGLLVEGGPTRQSFAGSAARILPQVMAALDGTRTVPELAAHLQLDPERLWPMLSLLYATGLLEEGLDCLPVTAVEDPGLAFLARSLDTTRVNRNGFEALERLSTACVTIVADAADAAFAGGLAELLLRERVGSVRVTATLSPESDPGRLVILVGDSPRVEAAALAARSAGVSALPVQAVAGTVQVGPLLDPAHSACAVCAFTQRSQLELPGGIDRDGSPAGVHWSRAAALLVVRDVVALLSRVGTSSSERFLVCTDLIELTQASWLIAPDPACIVCMDPGPDDAEAPGLPLAWVYAHSVAFPPRDTLNPKDHQVHYKSSNLALQQNHRRWLAAARVELPEAERQAARHDRGLSLHTVMDLLERTVGLRNGPTASAQRVDRWCATGGNLGSPTGYLVARAVDGLEPGVYGFQRHDASLARLGWADPETPVPGIPDDAAAAIVLTGAMDVVSGKYGAFAWRIVHLDAGAAIAQAQLLARQHGLGLCAAPTWDDVALGQLLGADLDREPVTAVLTLTTTGDLA